MIEENKDIEKIDILTGEEVKTKSLEELQNLFIQLQDIAVKENGLIEILQKENEELKEDNLGIREENIKLVNCHISYERYTGLDFLLPDKFKYAIPKEKIIEKIKELKEAIGIAKRENDIALVAELEIQIEILRELLKEE